MNANFWINYTIDRQYQQQYQQQQIYLQQYLQQEYQQKQQCPIHQHSQVLQPAVNQKIATSGCDESLCR